MKSYSLTELAQILGEKPKAIFHLIHQGKIPHAFKTSDNNRSPKWFIPEDDIPLIQVRHKMGPKTKSLEQDKLKLCLTCLQWKPIDSFYIKIKKTGHRFSWCKQCHQEKRNRSRPPKPPKLKRESIPKTDHRLSTYYDVQCATCGTLLKRTKYWLEKQTHFFCNQVCYGKWLAKTYTGSSSPSYKKVEVSCTECGKTILRRPFEIKKFTHLFCSTECRNKYSSAAMSGSNCHFWQGGQKVTIPCTQCGKNIERWKIDLQSPIGNFCDHVCYGRWISDNLRGPNNPMWEGGCDNIDYGPNWESQRNYARERDLFTCQRCGISEKELYRQLDVHHIRPFREFGLERYIEANNLENLISYCATCHTLTKHQQKKNNYSSLSLSG